MSEFITLLRFQLKTNLGLSSFLNNLRHDRGKAFKSLGIGLIILVLAASMIVSYVAMLSSLFQPLKKAGLEQLVLLMGVSGAMGFVVLFGFFYVFSTIFFARDTGFLASLPVKPGTIFAAKFGMVMLGEYLLTVPMVCIPGIYYGVGMGMGVAFYAKLAILTLLVPALPLAVVSLLSLLLMRVVSAMRKRNTLLSILGMLMVAGFVMGESLLMNKINDNMGKDMVAGLVRNQSDLIASAGRVFPPLEWAVNTLGKPGAGSLVDLLLFAAVSALALAVAVALASLLYSKGTSLQEETEKSGSTKAYAGKESSGIKAICMREWREILRNPTYAMNSMVGIIMGPIFFNKFLFGSILVKDPKTKPLFDMLTDGSKDGLLLLGIAAVLIMMCLTNSAAATVISREGRTFWLSKVIPVTAGVQITAKLIAMYAISALGIITTITALWLTFRTPNVPTLYACILAFVALVPLTALYVLIDLLNPKLVWDNYTQVIKQNTNVILSMLAGVVIAGVPGYGGYLLYTRDVGTSVIFSALMAFFIVLGIVLTRILNRTAEKQYRSI